MRLPRTACLGSLLLLLLLPVTGCVSGKSLPVTSYNLGVERWEADDLDGARRALAQALARDPDDADAQYRYGLLCAQLGDHAQAAQALERAVALQPRAPEYWTDLAVVYNNLGRQADARHALDKALALKPSMARPHFYLGLQAYQTGDRQRAQQHIRHAAELDPGYRPAREWLEQLETP